MFLDLHLKSGAAGDFCGEFRRPSPLDIGRHLRYQAGVPLPAETTGRHPLHGSPWRRTIALLWHRIAVAPWDRIDARNKGQSHVGDLTSRQAAIVTVITTCLMLITLRFVVMDSDVQEHLANGLESLVHQFAPKLYVATLRAHSLWVHLAWITGCITVYLLIPAVVLHALFGLKLREIYLMPCDYFKKLPIYALLFLPVGLTVVAAASQPDFQLQYPFYTGLHLWDQLTWELAYAAQFFALEFFFRGFILRGLSAEMGASAVLAMAMPYCMLHYGKPLPECLGSIAAGTVLGILAMDTKSIWGGVTIHVAVAWSMDAAALVQKSGRPHF